MSNKEKIFVGFHVGRIVQYLAATYGRWDQVIGELVQNALDAKASEMSIVLNIEDRQLLAWDNGIGASLPEMRTRIENIGAPIKEKLAKKRGPQIGRRGIGNLAPIAIKGENSKWVFQSHKISGCQSNRWYQLELDMTNLDDEKEVGFNPSQLEAGFKPVDERGSALLGVQTKVSMTNIEAAALEPLRRVDNPAIAIAAAISATFSATLLKTKNKIHVKVYSDGSVKCADVEPQRYEGEKRVVKIDGVEFEFYLRRSSNKQKTRIDVEHEEQISFPLSSQKDLWDLVSPVLACGYFQGIMKTRLGELVPNRTRMAFGKGYDQFCDAVVKFTTEHAEGWMNELAEANRDDRISKVIENVLDKLAPIVDRFPALTAVFRAAKNPVGHPSQEDEESGLHHHAVPPGGPHGGGGGGGKHKPGHPNPDRPSGPHVIRGGRVMRHTSGIAIKVVDANPTSEWGIAWRARVGDTGLEKGLLLVNKSHPDWRAAEATGDSALETYTLLVALATFSTAMSRNKDRGRIFQEEFEEHFLPIHGPLIPRIPSMGRSRMLKKRIMAREEE